MLLNILKSFRSRINRPPVSLSRLVANYAPTKAPDANKGRTAVVIATVTDDNRLLQLPKISVAGMEKHIMCRSLY